MDGNKDDALKCFRIAKGAIEAGDRTRAQKFLNKARRLDPALPIDDLLSSIGGSDPGGSANGPSGSASAKPLDQPSLRQRAAATRSSSAKQSSSPAAATYTEEQVLIVRQIKKKKMHIDEEFDVQLESDAELE